MARSRPNQRLKTPEGEGGESKPAAQSGRMISCSAFPHYLPMNQDSKRNHVPSGRHARYLLLSSMLGFASSSPGCAQDTTAAPPPVPLGRLVDIGGRRLHLYCTGAGSHTVVVENASSS